MRTVELVVSTGYDALRIRLMHLVVQRLYNNKTVLLNLAEIDLFAYLILNSGSISNTTSEKSC